MSRFRGPHQMGTSATGCKLCRAPLLEFSDVYFVYGLFVADSGVPRNFFQGGGGFNKFS